MPHRLNTSPFRTPFENFAVQKALVLLAPCVSLVFQAGELLRSWLIVALMHTDKKFVCLSCGSENTPTPFLKACPDYYLRKPFVVDYFKCYDCGLVQVYPVPEEVSAFYEAYPVHKKKSKLHEWLRKLVMAPAYFDFRELERGTSLLDYGCGDGWFLESCKDRGLTVVGFEPSTSLAKDLSGRLKIPVYSDPKKLTFDFHGTIDIVTAHFVVEHVLELTSTFRDISSILKPGGRFFFTVPNIDSWEARLFRKKWHGLDPPRHISFPTEPIVKSLALRNGLELLRTESLPFPNGVAGSIPTIVLGRFHKVLYALAFPCGILLSQLAPSGVCSFCLQKPGTSSN